MVRGTHLPLGVGTPLNRSQRQPKGFGGSLDGPGNMGTFRAQRLRNMAKTKGPGGAHWLYQPLLPGS